jgi:MFS family permease
VWSQPSYRRVTRYVAFHGFTFTALPGFLVLFLRDEIHLNDGLILKLAAGQTLGLILTSLFWGRLSDRTGSRPLMRLSLSGYLAVLALLFCGAGGLFSLTAITVGILYIVMGLLDGAQNSPMARLIMANCPEEELTVSMAFLQVWAALARGVAPIMWGLIIKSLRETSTDTTLTLTHPYAIFFGTSLALILVTQALLTRIREPQAHRAHQVLFYMLRQWPVRLLGVLPFWERGMNRKPPAGRNKDSASADLDAPSEKD